MKNTDKYQTYKMMHKIGLQQVRLMSVC